MRLVGQTATQLAQVPTTVRQAKAGRLLLTAVTSSPIQPKTKQVTRQFIARALQDHEISPTRQRIEIAYILFTHEQHLSAEQILAAVNAREIRASKATIYNTLNLFVQKHLVRELIIDPSRIFYDRNMEPHHHFYNVETGELTDIPADSIHIAGLPILPTGTTVENIDIIVRTRNTR